jgi:predicted GNAT superfamily acetyltransferase
MSETLIQPLRSSQQFQACEDIQTEVWGKVGASAELLKVTHEHGGTVLGAWTGGQICGFIYAFLARYHGQLVHWSHLMAVRERKRDRGLGFQMKLMHRQLALEQGIRSICWTFDPLQSRNAALNISRLGADVDEYIPDYYGEFASIIEKGLPSDRFVANWRIGAARVEKRLRRQSTDCGIPSRSCINETAINSDGFPENRRIIQGLTERELLLEIPASTDLMRQSAVKLARRWRMETRAIFQSYFSAGYRVADFLRDRGSEPARCFYLLRRQGASQTRRRAQIEHTE